MQFQCISAWVDVVLGSKWQCKPLSRVQGQYVIWKDLCNVIFLLICMQLLLLLWLPLLLGIKAPILKGVDSDHSCITVAKT